MHLGIAREPLNRGIPKGELVEDPGDDLSPHIARADGDKGRLCRRCSGDSAGKGSRGSRTADFGVRRVGSFRAGKVCTLIHRQHDLMEIPGSE